MDIEEKADLVAKTNKMYEEELYKIFKDPVSRDIEGYYDIIKRPICLKDISNKLVNNEYTHFIQWYNDMILMFENAKTFNPPTNDIHFLADYLQTKFEEEYHGRSLTTHAQWAEAVGKQIQKIQDLISKSPVTQGYDPLLKSIIAEAVDMPLSAHDEYMVSKEATKLIQENEKCRNEIYNIIQLLSPNAFNGTNQLEMSSLSDKVKNALKIYIDAKSGKTR